MLLKNGLKGLLTHKVGPADLATHWQNDIPVFATPILLWLAELACMRAIDNCLEPGQITLGYAHDVRHLAATPAGWTVVIEAELTGIESRLLTFEVRASDGRDAILSGRHTRAIVSRERFLAKLDSKTSLPPKPN